jgi:putative PIN family toxin of toxin-antitoxin system
VSDRPGKLKAVLDTSVLIRGILSGQGASSRILDYFFEGAFDLVLPLSVLEEVQAVLERVHIRTRSAFKAEDARELVLSLLDAAEVVAGIYRLELVPTDARDDHVVSAALETAADYLVSVDGRDLLPLKVIKVRGFRPIQIVDARAFLQVLRGR